MYEVLTILVFCYAALVTWWLWRCKRQHKRKVDALGEKINKFYASAFNEYRRKVGL